MLVFKTIFKDIWPKNKNTKNNRQNKIQKWKVKEIVEDDDLIFPCLPLHSPNWLEHIVVRVIQKRFVLDTLKRS